MKQDLFKQLEVISKTDIADPQWLSRTRTRVLAYAKLHPLRAKRFKLFPSWLHMAPAILMLAVMILVSAGGVTLASEGSIPGDLLYPWKISVVESLQSAFVSGTQERAEFEIARTSKRLQEVTELAVRKVQDTQITSAAHIRLEAQIKTASDQITKVAAEDQEKGLETAVELNATLQAHKEVLAQLQPKVDSETLTTVQGAISAIEKNSSDVTSKIQNLKEQSKQETHESPAQTAIAAAKLEAVKKKLDTAWDVASKLDESSKLRVEAEQKLTLAQDAVTAGDQDLEEKAYGDLMLDIQSANQLISETLALLDATDMAGATVKQILDGTPVAVASPTTSTTPTTTPLPSAIATPKQSLVISVTLDKETYLPFEIVNATIQAVNTSSVTTVLNWNSGCQVDIAVDITPLAKDRICTMVLGSMSISGQQSHAWTLQTVAPPVGGTHFLAAEVIGYGTARVPFTVIVSSPTPTGTPH